MPSYSYRVRKPEPAPAPAPEPRTIDRKVGRASTTRLTDLDRPSTAKAVKGVPRKSADE